VTPTLTNFTHIIFLVTNDRVHTNRSQYLVMDISKYRDPLKAISDPSRQNCLILIYEKAISDPSRGYIDIS